MAATTVHVICCDSSPQQWTELLEIQLDPDSLADRIVDTLEQEIEAGTERGLHNAAHHEAHGVVTYLQHVHEGGFAVSYGDPDNLQETFFGPGSWVGFMDDQGPGHGSKVGPDGVKRTLRIVRGYLDV